MSFSNKTSFAVKDPCQRFNIKAVVGQEQPTYNSFIKANLYKLSTIASIGINCTI